MKHHKSCTVAYTIRLEYKHQTGFCSPKHACCHQTSANLENPQPSIYAHSLLLSNAPIPDLVQGRMKEEIPNYCFPAPARASSVTVT